jgi:prevent-host-death family protein
VSAVSVRDLRRDLARVTNTVAFGKERIIVERHGKPLMALVPLEDLELVEVIENEGLIALADRAEAESAGQPRIPLDEVVRESERRP